MGYVLHSKLCGTTILRMWSKFEWCQGEIKDARNLYDQVCRLISWKVYVAFLKLIHYDTYSLLVVPIYSDFKYPRGTIVYVITNYQRCRFPN